jgi:hypothetical protein
LLQAGSFVELEKHSVQVFSYDADEQGIAKGELVSQQEIGEDPASFANFPGRAVTSGTFVYRCGFSLDRLGSAWARGEKTVLHKIADRARSTRNPDRNRNR